MKKRIVLIILLVFSVFGTLLAGGGKERKETAKIHIANGQGYLLAGKYTKAIEEFNAAIELDPKNKLA